MYNKYIVLVFIGYDAIAIDPIDNTPRHPNAVAFAVFDALVTLSLMIVLEISSLASLRKLDTGALDTFDTTLSVTIEVVKYDTSPNSFTPAINSFELSIM